MIRMIQVEALKLQPCPTLFSKVSHHLSAILEVKATIFANCSRVIPRSAVSSMQKVSFDVCGAHQHMQQMKLEWNSKRIVQCSKVECSKVE